MINIPREEFSFKFSKSSGAGGQNVNKLNTKVSLSWNIYFSPSLPDSLKKRFIARYERFIVGENVQITSQKYRSQKRNLEDCVVKLQELLASVRFPPKKRVPTKPSRSSVKKRLEEKKKHGERKKERSKKIQY